jgi:hypothetical protein
MAKLTYLQMVQFILSSMDSDDVSTITETIESQQVADIIEETFYEILDRREWEFLKHRLRQLDLPTAGVKNQLDIPADVTHVECVRYKDFDTGKFKDVTYLSPKDFVEITQNRDTSQSNIEAVTISDAVTLSVFNDRVPVYWTSFDEDTIFFDALDTGTEATLTIANSQILAQVQPTITQADATIPELPSRMFSFFLHEAKSACWLQLKQEGNPKSEQIARRQYIKLRELERRTVKDLEEIDYGR